MKYDNKPTYKFNWWKGFEMHKKSQFIETCFGIGALMVSFGVMTFFFFKGLAAVIH